MLIGISGTLSSGKTEVARYLTLQDFDVLALEEVNTNNGHSTITGHACPSNSFTNSDSHTVNHNLSFTLPIFKVFHSFEELLSYVTANWRRWFVVNINDLHVLRTLQKKPFFLHISIDAPIRLRYDRFIAKNKREVSLQEFIDASDESLYSPANPFVEINNQALINIINTSNSIESLHSRLSELNLLDSTRLRPTWDAYFMRLADLAALRSNCMKRRVGCVIVRDMRVIATGYNGTPRYLLNCNQGGCPRCNDGNLSGASLSTCLCLHAEENALLEAGRDRITGGQVTGISVLYCNTCPCLTCAIKIVQSSIREVVYAQSYSMDSESRKLLSDANVILRQYNPPPMGGIFI